MEGISDRVAIEALAERLDLDLRAEHISVIEMGGATGIGAALDRYGPNGLDVRLAGVFDAAEAGVIARHLHRAGVGPAATTDETQALGFHMCVNDLEEELIRAVGVDALEGILDLNGDLRAFRTLQRQPEWRGKPVADQFRRFLGSGARRKTRYARLLIETANAERLPEPLLRALEHVRKRR